MKFPMYVAIIFLTMVLLPVGSIVVAHVLSPADPLIDLVGRWFVFWGAGVRLALAGLRQVFQPRFTARKIFQIDSDDALILVREIGVANLATATISLLSLAYPSFTLPAAISAGIFYAGAGVGHIVGGLRTTNEMVAMASDLSIATIFLVFVLSRALA